MCHYYVILMTHTFKHSWYMTLPYHVSPIILLTQSQISPDAHLPSFLSNNDSLSMTHFYESLLWAIIHITKKPQMFQNINGSYITTFPYSSSYSHVKVMWQITWCHNNVTMTHTMTHFRDMFISCPTDDFSFIKPIKLLLTLQSADCWSCQLLKFVENLLQIHLCIV